MNVIDFKVGFQCQVGNDKRNISYLFNQVDILLNGS